MAIESSDDAGEDGNESFDEEMTDFSSGGVGQSSSSRDPAGRVTFTVEGARPETLAEMMRMLAQEQAGGARVRVETKPRGNRGGITRGRRGRPRGRR